MCKKETEKRNELTHLNQNGEAIMVDVGEKKITERTAKAFILAKKMAAKMMETLHCDGVNIVQNNGVAAGQTVFHFHIHLIPRYEGDNAGVTWTPGTLTDEGKEEILKAFAAAQD